MQNKDKSTNFTHLNQDSNQNLTHKCLNKIIIIYIT